MTRVQGVVIACSGIAITSVAFAQSQPKQDYRVAARTANLWGNAQPDVEFGQLGVPRLNNAGEIVFAASLTNGETDGRLWSEAAVSESLGDGLVVFAAEGESGGGLPQGLEFGRFLPDFAVYDNTEDGQTWLLTELQIPSNNSRAQGLFSGSSLDDFGLVIREGQRLPGRPAGTFLQTISRLGIVDSGAVRFVASEGQPTSATSFLAIARPGEPLELLGLTGDAPGFTDGTTLDQFDASTLEMSGRGDIAYQGRVSLPGESANVVVVRRDGQPAEIVARGTTPAPGFSEGFIHSFFNGVAINSSGDLLFVSRTRVPGVTGTASDTALYRQTAGFAPELVIRSGQTVQGNDDAIKVDLFDPPLLNERGEWAMAVSAASIIPGLSEEAILVTVDGSPTVAVRTGQPVPELEPGQTIGPFEQIKLNANGQIAFISDLGFGSGGNAVFVTDYAGQPHLALAEGQAIDISAVPGVPAVHVVDEITRSLGFNDRGEVAITVRFVGSANQQVIVVFDMPRLPECPADINLDASLNIDDFSAFVDGFFSALPRTDIDDNGTLGIDDFSAFVMAFFAGC